MGSHWIGLRQSDEHIREYNANYLTSGDPNDIEARDLEFAAQGWQWVDGSEFKHQDLWQQPDEPNDAGAIGIRSRLMRGSSRYDDAEGVATDKKREVCTDNMGDLGEVMCPTNRECETRLVEWGNTVRVCILRIS